MSKQIALLFIGLAAVLCHRCPVVAQDPGVYAKLKHGDRDIVQVNSVAFSPDGNKLAVAYFLSDANPVRNKHNAIVKNETGDVVVWDVGKKYKLTVIKCNGLLRFVAFSSDGMLLAVAEGDRVKILDSTTWKDRYNIAAKPEPNVVGWITSLAFSPNGKILAIGTSFPAGDGTRLILWDVNARKSVRKK
jgi:WD40 repeat protein